MRIRDISIIIIFNLLLGAFILHIGNGYALTLDSIIPPSTSTPTSVVASTKVPIIYGKFWLEREGYYKIFSDNIVSDEEIEFLYKVYYTPLPKAFLASASRFGSDELSCMELEFYGKGIRAEMVRGWVLVGSGEYGYHPELKEDLSEFIQKYYRYKNKNNILLSKESSPLFDYFADGGLLRSRRDKRNQPIPVMPYELNKAQKRIYDITPSYDGKCTSNVLMSIDEQSKMTEEEALSTGKYISLVSAKSPNDIGRIFFIYDISNGNKKFLGVTLVVGTAKKSDWTGYGDTTSNYFQWNQFPLALQKEGDYYWAFDFPNALYYYLEGDGGLIKEILAIDAER